MKTIWNKVAGESTRHPKNAAEWSSWVCLHYWLMLRKVLCKMRHEKIIWPSKRKRSLLMNRSFCFIDILFYAKYKQNFFKLMLCSTLIVNTLVSKLALMSLMGNTYWYINLFIKNYRIESLSLEQLSSNYIGCLRFSWRSCCSNRVRI